MINRRVIAAALLLSVAARPARSQGTAQPLPAPNVIAVNALSDVISLVSRPPVIVAAGRGRANDGGGGLFQWIAGDDSPVDGALVVAPGAGEEGRYRRVHDGAVDVRWFGAMGDGLNDDTVALQAALDHCSSDDDAGPALYIPGGRYRITAPLTISRQFVQIEGDGMWRSSILFDGVVGGAIVAAKMKYLRPVLRDFAVLGDAASGKGIDFSAVYGDVYLGELRNLNIVSGDDGFYSIRFFSMTVDTVSSSSFRGHSFRVACGPAVSWRNCYAVTAGPGKAGYRLTGTIALYSCNGVNHADYWGVFGADPKVIDGFENDFSERSYADVTMIECNVEDFCGVDRPESRAASAIVLHSAYRQFIMIGGKFDRSQLSTPYHSIIRSRVGSNTTGAPIRLSPGFLSIGRGRPTGAYFFSDGNSFFSDEIGSLSGSGLGTWKEGGREYPLIRTVGIHDTPEGAAMHFSALSSSRLTVNAMRFNPAVAPSGASAISAPGRTVIVTDNKTPTVVSSIAASSENGFLIVQVEDAFTTFKHRLDVVDGLRLKGNADYSAEKGAVLLFVRSRFFNGTHAGWVQI